MKKSKRVGTVLIHVGPAKTPTYEDLTECQKAAIYMQGIISGMWRRGEVATSGALGAEGMALFERLKADGYEPTHEQQRQTLEQMLRLGQIEGFTHGAGKAFADKFWPGQMMMKQPGPGAN